MGLKLRQKLSAVPIWVRWGLGGILAGALIAWGSLVTYANDPWMSGILANLGVTVLLIMPAAYIGHRFSDWIGQVNERTQEATGQAKTAEENAAKAQADVNTLATSVETNLASLREQLIADQVAEFEKEHSAFGAIAQRGDRESIVEALKAGRESGLVSRGGVRAPVWETNLHLRFLLSEDGETLTVNFEENNGEVAASHVWTADASSLDFYRELWRSVQKLGEYLGAGHFDPTESLERLSEALEYASRYRAHKLRMGAQNVRDIIEFVDGWYITDHGMFPKGHEYYLIAASRLWEMDWEYHISGKNWGDDDNIVVAIEVARALHSSKRSPEKTVLVPN